MVCATIELATTISSSMVSWISKWPYSFTSISSLCKFENCSYSVKKIPFNRGTSRVTSSIAPFSRRRRRRSRPTIHQSSLKNATLHQDRDVVRQPLRVRFLHRRSSVFIGRIRIGIGVFDQRNRFLSRQGLSLRIGERVTRAKHGTRATRRFHQVERV